MGYHLVTNDGAIHDGGWNTQRSLVRDATGRWYCTFRRIISSVRQIFIAYSDDNGLTWTEEQVTTADANQGYSCLAIDSAGAIYVAWKGLGYGSYPAREQICYRRRSAAGSWDAIETITNADTSYGGPTIAVDSANNVHITTYGAPLGTGAVNQNNSQILYRKKSAGSWGSLENLTDVAPCGGLLGCGQKCPAIAIDSANQPHVVWYGADISEPSGYYFQVWYKVKSGGSWSARERVSSLGSHYDHPGLAIDSSGNVHVGFREYFVTDRYNIYYRKRTALGWDGIETLFPENDYPQGVPCLSIDTDGNVHAVWNGKGYGTYPAEYNTRHRIRTAAGWGSIENLTDWASDVFGNPVLIYQVTPSSCILAEGIAFVQTYVSGRVYFYIGGILPQVTTDPATETSTLNGTLDDDGGEACDCGFEWGPTVAYGNTTPTQSRTMGQIFSQAVGPVAPGTTYHFRAFATNAAGTSYGNDRTFDTPVVIPLVTTNPPTAISQASAALNGILDDDAGEACDCGFEWGFDTSYGLTTPTQSKITGETFSQAIHGLFSGFTYHFRAFATNSIGTGYGADRSFTATPTFNRAHALSREEL